MTFFLDPVGFLCRMARDYGDLVHVRARGQDIYLLNDPEAIKDVLITHHRQFIKGEALQDAKQLLGEGLLTSEGDLHRRQRRLIQPAFQPRALPAYAPGMVECAVRHQERWRSDETRDLWREMMGLAMAIVSRTLFGAAVDAEAGRVSESLTAAMEAFRLLSLPLARRLMRYPIPPVRRFQRAKAHLDELIYRMIRERRERPADREDLLSLLLSATDEAGDGTGMTDVQLHDEAMTLFLAGHETMATALTWTWYLLSRNPQAEAKLHAEIDSVLAGRTPRADDIERLPYTGRVFAESMRVFPPAWAIGRRAVEAIDLCGYSLPAGSLVVMSPYVMHHDPRYYPDPERFDPDRWLPDARAGRPRFAYFPFGGGPRNCIGEGFAWMEGILVLATLAQRWTMRLAPRQRIGMLPLITLRPRHGMRMIVERRGG